MARDILTVKYIKDKKHYDLLWWDGSKEKNLGFAHHLETILWFYMQEKNLDIYVDDGDNITPINKGF
jgi:hypothetical protein